jgi:hypothetical protein
MTEEEIRDRLKPYNAKALSERTGLPYFAVWRFIAGKTVKPSFKLVSTLEAFLREQGQ